MGREGLGAEMMVRDVKGNEVDYEAAVELMDDDLREELHYELAPCAEQEFFEAYATRHNEKHGEGFAPYVGGEW